MKAFPFAAMMGVLSARDAIAYAGVASMLSAIVVVGALWGAAKAWRERAEARADEADQLAKQAALDAEKLTELDRSLIQVKAELKARPDLRDVLKEIRTEHGLLREADAEEHRAIIATLERVGGSMQQAIETNTVALEALAKHVPWADILGTSNQGDRQ